MRVPNWKAWGGVLLLLCLPCALWAGNFRIETEVFVPDQPQPVSKNLTLFSDGLVYDFSLKDSQEIAILDMQRQRFILLDPVRQVKTEFDCKELFQFNNQLQGLARSSGKKLLQFAADPKFAENYVRQANNNGTLTLTSGVIDYQVATIKPQSAELANDYGTFADWYSRLNTVHPGSLPPFHRLHLNAVLVKHGVVPTRVERTVFQGDKRGETVRSEHKVDWLLTATDRQKIAQTGAPRVEYKKLTFAEYYVVKETPK